MGARPWLPVTLITCDTGAARGSEPRGGQFQTARQGSYRAEYVWYHFTHPHPIIYPSLIWNLLSFFIANRLKWGVLLHLGDDCSARYILKDWRPGFKLVQTNPGLVNCNWLNGTLSRGCLRVRKWIAAFVEGTGLTVEWWATAKEEEGFSD